jgi:hypothetical protein
MSNDSIKNEKAKRKGCLIILFTVIFIIGSAIYFMTAQIRDTKRVEQTLIDRFGWAEQYTPPIDGFITPQRMESFLRVREAVQNHCVDYQAILADVTALETLENNQEISTGDKASRGMEGIKSIFSAGPKVMEFLVTRNKVLLDENMGLGEYLYIYLTAYAELLANESLPPYADSDESIVSRRARREFVQILDNQVTALETSGHASSFGNLRVKIKQEIEAIKDGSHVSPWSNGHTGKTRESLGPYQTQLADLYCSGIVKIELMQKNRGFQFDD